MMMNYYAAGGQAQKLASYGRGGDTELVHMTKGEIKGLQDLALAYGGSLSINPNTGLVEAGFLKRLLPTLAGAALAATGVGAPMAALIVGGGYGLATGSITKGLMAGLGAYGGAGLTSSLGALGGETLATSGQDAALNAFKETQQQAITSGLENTATYTDPFLGSVPPPPPPSSYAIESAKSTIGNLKNLPESAIQNYQSALNAPGVNPQDVVSAAGRAQGATGATAMGNVSRGIGEVFSSPSAAGQFAKSNIGALGSAIVPSLLPDQQQSAGPAGYQEDEYDRQLKGYRMSPNYQAYEASRPNPYYQATYAAAGGVMNSFDDENGSDSNMASGGIAQYKNKGQVNVLQEYLNRQAEEQTRQSGYLPESVAIPRTGIFRDTDVDTARKTADEAAEIRLGKAFKAAGIKPVAFPKTAIRGLGDISGITRDTTEVAKGGVMSSLGGYSDGGRMLKGPGDGMSDSIPASIAGKQPARLADGEFVVPADVVSHLGNGSTDAGAKKLYAMMDKIRKARTGKKKQAPAVTASKYMPA